MKPARHPAPTIRALRQAGFTLMEAVIVIAITGIIGGMVAMFIRVPVQGYIDAAARAELTDAADTTIRRMTRELRLALPNSIRVAQVGDDWYLEFLMTKTGGRYLDAEDGLAGQPVLSFTDTASRTFTVVGPMPSGRQAIVAGDSVVVHNLGPGFPPADAYSCPGSGSVNGCNLATVAADPVGNVVTLTGNPFAAQTIDIPPLTRISMPSPSRRFHVVQTAVTYRCHPAANGGGTLTRYSGYAIQPSQPTDIAAAPLSAGVSALLANRIGSCGFQYDQLAHTRLGLVGITLGMEVGGSNSGSVVLFQQVHVSNSP